VNGFPPLSRSPRPSIDEGFQPESIRRNTFFGLVMRVGASAFTAALTLFLVRRLGPTDYGLFVLTLAVGGLLLLPSDFGISQSSARFIAENRGNTSAISSLLGDALTLKLITSALVAVAIAALAAPVADLYGTAELTVPLRVMAIAVFAQSVMLLMTTSFEALGRNSTGFRLFVSESAVEAGTSVALVLLGGGVVGAVAGRAVGYGFGVFLGAVLLARLIDARIRPSLKIGSRGRRLARYAGALFIIDGAWAAFSQIDILLIGAILSPRSAGLFGAPIRLLTVFGYPSMAAASGVAPRLARHEQHPPNVAAFRAAIRFLIIFQLVLVAPAVVWAEPIVDLVLGDGYQASAQVLRGLAPFLAMTGLVPLLSVAVNYLGEARRRVWLAIGTLALNAAIDAVLLPRIGIVAAAIGTDAAVVLYLAGHLQICRSEIELPLAPIFGTLARCLLGVTAMAGVLLAFGTTDLSPLAAVGGTIGGLLAYVGALVLSGEVPPGEIRRLPQAASGLIRAS
jgi:O-antigen/teichoic acid export membrane protein